MAMLIIFIILYITFMGLPYSSDSKEPVCKAGDPGSIPGSQRSPGEGNGSLLQYRIPWTKEADGLQSMGSQRVRHD